MIALDTGVLLLAVNRYAPEHARATGVLEDLANGDRPWALPWPALYEFLAQVTHPHAVARPLRASDAWNFIGPLLASPSVRPLGPTPRHATALVEVLGLMAGQAAPPRSVEIAVLLREHGVRELLSTDREMRRFRFLSVIDPVHGPAWTPDARPARRHRVLAPRPHRS